MSRPRYAVVGGGVAGAATAVHLRKLGFDGEIRRDGPMELGLHHHRHWAPSRRLRVRLTPIEMSPRACPR